MIHCSGVCKSYDHRAVLDGITFDIREGKIFGLLGPSGAGKTTLIKILTGQLSYDGGEARVLGREAGKLTGEDKKKIGIMMDQFGVYDRLSCADNLKIYADIYGIRHGKVREILEDVGLKDAAGSPRLRCRREWGQG